jgi:mono/diheme cytochrome c family protein
LKNGKIPVTWSIAIQDSVMKKLIVIVGCVVLILVGAGVWGIGSARGFSARQEPSKLEAALARSMRRMAIPSEAKSMTNPMPLTPELMVDARRHFADHCSVCHANDGSGKTDMGQNLYPKVPDMREQATQSLSDGELYFIIHNGIRLSGMPAWGAESDHDHESWALVHFIRHLPSLSADELQDMKRFNPLSPAELEEQREEEEFLNGKPERK